MQQQQQYVGIDLHRRRSVIVRMNEAGEVLSTVQIDNDPVALAMAVAEAGPDPEVALESTYGWYWAADLLQAEGARVHLVHPLGLHWDTRRVKNDVKDATELANRLRRNDLPESVDRPAGGAGAAGARPVPGQADGAANLGQGPGPRGDGQAWGSCPQLADMFGPGGQVLLDEMGFEGVYGLRVESLRDLLEIYDRELAMVEREMRTHAQRPRRLSGHPGHQRGGPDHGGHLRGRDRRRHPLPDRPASVLVGRV